MSPRPTAVPIARLAGCRSIPRPRQVADEHQLTALPGLGRTVRATLTLIHDLHQRGIGISCCPQLSVRIPSPLRSAFAVAEENGLPLEELDQSFGHLFCRLRLLLGKGDTRPGLQLV
ncbi:hypothetical protein RW1_031_00430 [Rhodococcus wratislaviensis NBRC 100605]|uniref:Uncharacterized protein n=1 Tax=Rhodococcus wratislaviensis NBRC 100605 TaxID=1219028 RepID=X0R6B5_RHOWR|nr:hypothetical protein RW1_031_00430 [Rhodococcus wratislaviensis NBRC 100605]